MRSTSRGERFTGVSVSKTPDARLSARMRPSACRTELLEKSTFQGGCGDAPFDRKTNPPLSGLLKKPDPEEGGMGVHVAWAGVKVL